MTARLRTDETFRVTVTAASPAAPLAIEYIAGKLGIEPARVARQLAALPAVLAKAIPDRDARRMAAMLSLVGVQVRLDPALSSDRSAAPVAGNSSHPVPDVALHLAEGADRVAAIARLGRVLGAGTNLSGLELAGGMVLAGLSAAERARILHDLRRGAGIRVTLSCPSTARYDLFAPRSIRLCAEIARLGLGRCRFSGAVAGGMNLTTGRILLGRAGPDAVLIDRAFQRFDLVLVAAPGMARAELADFLATRRDAAAVAPGAMDGDHPLRLDADLSRAAAARFIADYAAIGIEAAARLRGTLPESP